MLQFYYRHHPTVHRLNPGAVRAVQVREESDALVKLTRFGSDSDELIDTVLHPWINEGRKEGRFLAVAVAYQYVGLLSFLTY